MPRGLSSSSPKCLSMDTAGQNKGFHQIQRRLKLSIYGIPTRQGNRSFLGMVNYLNQYSALSAHLCAPLSALTDQVVDYKPSKKHFENFKTKGGSFQHVGSSIL